jgi:CBS domain-containing protein
MRVRDVMTSDIGCCTVDSTIQEAAQLMVQCNCGCVPIVEDRLSMQLVGLITDRDIACRAVAKGLECTAPANQIMSTQIASVRPDDSLEKVEAIMEDLQVRRVPVVNELGCCVGMISQADLALSAPPDEAAEVLRHISQPAASGR